MIARCLGFRAERISGDEGYRILRIWNGEVLTNLDAVYRTIADELDRITPAPTLPHRGGESNRRDVAEAPSYRRQRTLPESAARP